MTGPEPLLRTEYREHRRAGGLALRIGDDGTLKVSVGRRVSRRAAEAFIASQADWIARTRARMLATAAKHPAIRYADGEELPVLGEPIRLAIHPEAGRRRITHALRDGVLAVRVPSGLNGDLRATVRRAVRKLCAEQLTDWAGPVAARLSARLGAEPSRLKIGDFTSQWGSCSHDGVVALNWRLALAPVELAEYVLAHELVHLKVRGHPPKFWSVLEALRPGSLRDRLRLRRSDRELMRY